MDNTDNENRNWSTINVNIPKYLRFIIFIVFVFFILKTIYKISEFFNINTKSSHTYFIWFSILLFFFVLLPIKKSVFS